MKLLPYIELFIFEKKNYQNLSDKTLFAYRYDLNELLEIPFSLSMTSRLSLVLSYKN